MSNFDDAQGEIPVVIMGRSDLPNPQEELSQKMWGDLTYNPFHQLRVGHQCLIDSSTRTASALPTISFEGNGQTVPDNYNAPRENQFIVLGITNITKDDGEIKSALMQSNAFEDESKALPPFSVKTDPLGKGFIDRNLKFKAPHGFETAHMDLHKRSRVSIEDLNKF